MKIVQEFKKFAMRGNVVDMAVGIILGGAFGKIVDSIVKDVVMPPIGLLLSGVDFSSLKIVIKDAVKDAAGTTILKPEVAISYGAFINTVISFVIIAFSIFVVVKLMNAMQKKEEAKPAAAPAPTKDQELLAEIRDLLKAKA
jgi:large conductance mechanosensitive channel